MNSEILKLLRAVTPEERELLQGKREIEKQRYFYGENSVIDRKKMLERGQLIAVRTHTRFVDFPSHSHDFIEMQYVCSGSVVNIIDGKRIKISQGEILLLGQNIAHEILKCGADDIVINFIVLPQFFDVARGMIGNKNVLSDFLLESLKSDDSKSGVLYFKTSGNIEIENLIENLIISIKNENGSSEIDKTTMGLVFMHLLKSAENIESIRSENEDDFIIMAVMKYIENFYKCGSLSELCAILGYNDYSLSKYIKLSTGFTYKQLMQRKRLKKSVELLCETKLPVCDIVTAVGYENSSYFHKKFKENYGMSPAEFRKLNYGRKIVNIKRKL